MNSDLSYYLWTLACINLVATALFAATEGLARWRDLRRSGSGELRLDDWIEQMDQQDGGDFLPQTAESCREQDRAA